MSDKKGFRSPWRPGTTTAVIIFIILFGCFLVFGEKARADTMMNISAGATFVGGEKYDSEAFMLVEQIDDKYEFGLLLQLRLDCIYNEPQPSQVIECRRGESERSNQAVFGQRVVKWGDFKIGIGVSYWHSQSPAWNSHTPFVLNLNYELFSNFNVSYWHFSTGGSSDHNGGLDFVGVGYSF